MKKVLKLLMLGILATLVLYILLLSYDAMLFLPKQELAFSSASPSGSAIIRVYYNTGGATVADSTTADVLLTEKGIVKNIYFSYREKSANVFWISDTIVFINGHYINIYSDSFDSRR